MNAATSILTHRVDGSGDPILLLNGGMMTLANWNPIAQPLSATGRVIRCDFRGQWLSPGPPLRGRLSEHVDDVVALLDELQVERAHVIGTSFGGEVATLLAATKPARVRSLVVATAADRGTRGFEDGILALRRACDLAISGEDRFAMFDLLMAETYSQDYLDANRDRLAGRRNQVAAMPDTWFAGTASILDALVGLDLRPHLPHISCPTLVVIAEHDCIMPLERSRGLVSGIPGAVEILVPGSGHAVVVEKPEEFVRICQAFLENQIAGRSGSPRGPRTAAPS